MYLYCHAITNAPGDPGGIRNAAFVLTGGERVTLGDLYRESPTAKPLPGNPLVFINACESAELRPEFYDGFIPYFMAKGARGVVGTECKTPAIFASEWALRFFPRFLDGEPLGDLFLDAAPRVPHEARQPARTAVQRLLRRRHPRSSRVSRSSEGALHAHPTHRRHRRAVLSPLLRRARQGASRGERRPAERRRAQQDRRSERRDHRRLLRQPRLEGRRRGGDRAVRPMGGGDGALPRPRRGARQRGRDSSRS